MALYRSPDYQTGNYQSNGLSVHQKKFYIDFKGGSQLGFPIRTILATFDLQVTSILPMKFESIALFGSGEKVQNRFSAWLQGRPSWIFDQNDFSHFWSTSHPYTSFQVNGPFYSGEEVQNRFLWRQMWWPSCISNQNNFSYFWSTSHLDDSYQVSSQLAFWFRRSEK